jgi:undecaprenyl diphosphate synthase
MRLLRVKLESQARRCIESGMRLGVIGRRDRLPRGIVHAIERVERATEDGRRLHVRVALDYSAREAIAAAALRWAATASPAPDGLARTIVDGAGDVDLLVRTGGEQRLSDFLLWECAYAELYFTARMWPDFTAHDLAAAVAAFARRERRFGTLQDANAAGGAR